MSMYTHMHRHPWMNIFIKCKSSFMLMIEELRIATKLGCLYKLPVIRCY